MCSPDWNKAIKILTLSYILTHTDIYRHTKLLLPLTMIINYKMFIKKVKSKDIPVTGHGSP
jgi:hypothetical protein